MVLLGGPPKAVLLQMSQGIAMSAMQIQFMNDMDEDAQTEMEQQMLSEGSPTNMKQLIRMASQVISQHKMGWYKRNLFLGMIYGNLVAMGMSESEAGYLKGQIQQRAR